MAPCHSASSVVTMSPPPALPTLLTRMSMRPNVSSAARTTRSAPSGVATSAVTVRIDAAGRPRATSAAAAALSASAPRAHSTTRQPSSASACADASPSPRLDPVTMATWLSRCKCMGTGHFPQSWLVRGRRFLGHLPGDLRPQSSQGCGKCPVPSTFDKCPTFGMTTRREPGISGVHGDAVGGRDRPCLRRRSRSSSGT